MTTFDDRERAFENRFAHDEAARFRVGARRNRDVAAWVSAALGRTGEAAAAYEAEILAAALAAADDAALARRFTADLAAGGHAVGADAVEAAMTRAMAAALSREQAADPRP